MFRIAIAYVFDKQKHKLLLFCFLVLLPIHHVEAQTTGKIPLSSKKKITGDVYKEIPLEDFENFDLNSLKTDIRGEIKVNFSLHQQNPAPLANSKNYLGVVVDGDDLGSFVLSFAKPPLLDQHCRKINLWVFGTQLSGTLYAVIEDTRQNQHTVKFDSLNFRGWKKLSAVLGWQIHQKNMFIFEEKKVRLLQIKYFPGPKNRSKKWQSFYIDDISAEVRPKYQLP